MSYALVFLGVGSAHAVELGSASAVLERDGRPSLMIDCGAEALDAYLLRYGRPPDAIFVTHAHLDHIGGMERLFYSTYFDEARRGKLRLYVPASIVGVLQERLANYPNMIAEGGANFWDAFSLVPVGPGFWHEGLWFDIFATRHHAPLSSWGLALWGSFVYTGDTRPIPEIIDNYGSGTELVAHDCGLKGNPSHTGLDDLQREYSQACRNRMVIYHYGSAQDGAALRESGLRVAEAGSRFELDDPRVEDHG